jgi:uncharacterized protein (TIGR02284 family)
MRDTQSLKSLHTTLIDAEEGYHTAIRDAEAPDMKAIFEKLAALHGRGHADVHGMLMEAGERPNESGSFLSLVHKTVISVRSAVKGLDRSSLPSFADGEMRIVEAYDKALADMPLSDPARSRLLRDREELEAAITEMRAKAA